MVNDTAARVGEFYSPSHVIPCNDVRSRHRWSTAVSAIRRCLALCALAALAVGVPDGRANAQAPTTATASPDLVQEHNVAIPMRDGVVLRAEVWRPRGEGKHPVLVYRTPYGKDNAVRAYAIFAKAVARGYAVVAQDVRGRYASDGVYRAYHHDGKDGYDTIEWAAQQPWSNGAVGTFGLSYPGAVQWLAAVERPPHLRAMVPAMTYASPMQFFYSGGVWDASWAIWTWHNIAPDLRKKMGVAGPTTSEAAAQEWSRVKDRINQQLPLLDLPDFATIAPWYYDWLRHGAYDPWWEWADLTGKYDRTSAAVLNLSGWHDDAYGPHGATENFRGLIRARAGGQLRSKLLMGPWPHGVGGMARTRVGDRDVGQNATIDYDETILRWMDRWVRDLPNGVDREPAVRVFVMGSNRWIDAETWPIPGLRPDTLAFAGGTPGKLLPLQLAAEGTASASSSFISDPARPVPDVHDGRSGAKDYRMLASRPDVLTFETAPLERDVTVVGAMRAEIWLSADAPDVDLWVKVLDVAPDGTAWNLMSPGLELQRVSYRSRTPKRELLSPGRPVLVTLPDLLTANTFRAGHRIRVHVLSSFYPHFSRNLQTGELEQTSSGSRSARITIHHSPDLSSRIILPVLSR